MAASGESTSKASGHALVPRRGSIVIATGGHGHARNGPIGRRRAAVERLVQVMASLAALVDETHPPVPGWMDARTAAPGHAQSRCRCQRQDDAERPSVNAATRFGAAGARGWRSTSLPRLTAFTEAPRDLQLVRAYLHERAEEG